MVMWDSLSLIEESKVLEFENFVLRFSSSVVVQRYSQDLIAKKITSIQSWAMVIFSMVDLYKWSLRRTERGVLFFTLHFCLDSCSRGIAAEEYATIFRRHLVVGLSYYLPGRPVPRSWWRYGFFPQPEKCNAPESRRPLVLLGQRRRGGGLGTRVGWKTRDKGRCGWRFHWEGGTIISSSDLAHLVFYLSPLVYGYLLRQRRGPGLNHGWERGNWEIGWQLWGDVRGEEDKLLVIDEMNIMG